jgi:hypothetical protein
VLLVAPVGEHAAAALAHDDRRAGVLAHGEHPARRDAGVLQQVARDVPVVGGGLGVVQYGAQLAQVPGPQQMRDVPHALARDKREEFRRHLNKFSAERLACGYPLPGEQPEFRGIRTKRQQFGGRELGHSGTSSCGGAGRFMVGREPGQATGMHGSDHAGNLDEETPAPRLGVPGKDGGR